MADFKVRCTRSCDNRFVVGKVYEINQRGQIVGDTADGLGIQATRNFDEWYMRSHWIDYDFEKVEESKMFTNKDIRSADRVYTNSGCGIAIAFGDDLIVDYTDHSGWDDARSVTINKVVRPTIPFHMTKDGNCEGKVVYDRKAGIGCAVKEITVSEVEKALTEKFGENVKIVVGK